MFRISVLILCIYVYASCEVPDTNHCVRPYTHSEQVLIDSLEDIHNVYVEISRFNYPYRGDDTEICLMYETDHYGFEIANLENKLMTNIDTLRIIADALITQLYTISIEDSTLFFSSDFNISLYGKKTKNLQYKSGSVFIREYKKVDLENYFGFKIIRENSKLKRIETKKTIDSLVYEEMGSVF